MSLSYDRLAPSGLNFTESILSLTSHSSCHHGEEIAYVDAFENSYSSQEEKFDLLPN